MRSARGALGGGQPRSPLLVLVGERPRRSITRASDAGIVLDVDAAVCLALARSRGAVAFLLRRPRPAAASPRRAARRPRRAAARRPGSTARPAGAQQQRALAPASGRGGRPSRSRACCSRSATSFSGVSGIQPGSRDAHVAGRRARPRRRSARSRVVADVAASSSSASCSASRGAGSCTNVDAGHVVRLAGARGPGRGPRATCRGVQHQLACRRRRRMPVLRARAAGGRPRRRRPRPSAAALERGDVGAASATARDAGEQPAQAAPAPRRSRRARAAPARCSAGTTASGPTTSTPAGLSRSRCGVEQVGGAVQRDRGLAGAGAALDDEDAGRAARMTRSCSAWMVATMSRIRPVRCASARPAARPRPAASRCRRALGVEHLVLDAVTSRPCGSGAGGGDALRVGAVAW